VRALLLASLLAAPALAEEAPPGASSCLGCHSPVRGDAAIPSLRGRDAGEVEAAMRAFREGTRPATVMDRLARGFSAEESRAIAGWVVR
jgi:cytochrome c553